MCESWPSWATKNQEHKIKKGMCIICDDPVSKQSKRFCSAHLDAALTCSGCGELKRVEDGFRKSRYGIFPRRICNTCKDKSLTCYLCGSSISVDYSYLNVDRGYVSFFDEQLPKFNVDGPVSFLYCEHCIELQQIYAFCGEKPLVKRVEEDIKYFFDDARSEIVGDRRFVRRYEKEGPENMCQSEDSRAEVIEYLHNRYKSAKESLLSSGDEYRNTRDRLRAVLDKILSSDVFHCAGNSRSSKNEGSGQKSSQEDVLVVPKKEKQPVNVDDIYNFTIPSEAFDSGVYILSHEGEVVYVGQSKTVFSRIMSHSKKEEKQFDCVKFIPVRKQYLNAVEGALIRRLQPSLNKNNGPGDPQEDDAYIEAIRRATGD